MEEASLIVRQNLQKMQDKQKEWYDRKARKLILTKVIKYYYYYLMTLMNLCPNGEDHMNLLKKEMKWKKKINA